MCAEDRGVEERERAREIFLDALELPEERREAFVQEACSGSQAVRAEVESLLAGHASGRMPEQLDVGSAAILIEEEMAAGAAGWSIGPYRVVREIGRGGMGAVFLAERADGAFEQRVALKLVKRGMDSEAILGRFLRERQILARLEHPNIARLLDGGMSEDGRPYLVMEHVAGRPLTAYCDEERVDLAGRLDLFADICQAVQHAHRNLVVHRDLKPSNVLVTDAGRVKLLDFGIAKLLDDTGAGASTALTREAGAALTPQYAAPEQVRGEPATTATDVYALGLLLYELLSGERPYEVGAGAADAIRTVCETEPVPPSQAVSRSTGHGRRLRRRLQGDLDTIVLEALRKDPERRYPSAEALLHDLSRHRAGQPVEARPDTLTYRASRFVKRHAVGVVAAALVVLSLIAGLAGTAWQARARAREAAKAEEVKNFLAGLFAASDPDESRGEELTARQLLDRGVARLEGGLADQPDVEAEMLSLIGDLYVTLDELDAAEPVLARALELRRGLYGERHPDVAESELLLGRLRFAQGEYERAGEHYRRALDLQRSLLGPRDPAVARTLVDYQRLLQRTDRFEAAESAVREALDIQRQRLGDEHSTVANSTALLARILHRQGIYTDETDALFRRALELQRRELGELNSTVVGNMNNYANFLQDAGRLDDAEELLRRTLQVTRRLHGETSTSVADVVHALARLLKRERKFEAAEASYLQALEIYRAALGEDHSHVAVVLYNLGALRIAMGDYEGAEAYLRESLSHYRKIFGDRHHYVAMSLDRLGTVAWRRGDSLRAEKLYRESQCNYRASLGEEHPFTSTARLSLAQLLLSEGRPGEAEPLLRSTVRSWTAAFAEDDERLLEARRELARSLVDLGRFAEARDLLEEIYPLHRRVYGDEHAFTAGVRESLESATSLDGAASR